MPRRENISKLCFVIGPIGDDDSAERIHADWLFEEIVEPVFLHFSDFRVERSDKLAQPGLIDAQVINNLLSADLVIADLTGLNPNAFYEIGIRHMAQKPIIHMHQAGEKIPFDVSLYRSIKFSRARPRDIRAARTDLQRAVQAALSSDHTVENPVTNARGRVILEQHATPEQRILFAQMRAMEDRLVRIEGSLSQDAMPGLGLTSSIQRTSTPPPTSENYKSPFRPGDKVFHHKFGEGTLGEIDGNKLTIRFDKAGVKRVVDSFVARA